MDDLLNRAPCGFMTLADDGRILAANRTLLCLLGHETDALVGSHVEAILPVASRIFYQTHFFPLLKLHGKADEVYFSLRSMSGEEIPVLVNAARRECDGVVVVNDCIIIPMRQRTRYEDEILEAKREAEDANRIKDELITELSTPVITIWEGILLAPIIGNLTRERAEQMTDALLHATVERKAQVVILDITGVRTIDTAVIQRLVQSVAAIVLLGADCVLTGVSGSVAQTLVHLGLDLSEIKTRRRLAEGLKYALQIVGSKT